MALLRPIEVHREWHTGTGDCPRGLFCLGDAVESLEALLPEYEGRVKLVYMDPPFMTGDRFFMRVRVGEDMYRRRGGLAYFRSEKRLQKLMRREGLIGLGAYCINVSKRLAVQVLMPNALRAFVFRHFARKRPVTDKTERS